MCGSRPGAEAVTASTGTSASSASPFSARYAATRSSTAPADRGSSGPRFEPELAEPSYPGAGGRRARSGSTAAAVNDLTDQLAADDDTVAADQRAVGLVAEGDLADRAVLSSG